MDSVQTSVAKLGLSTISLWLGHIAPPPKISFSFLGPITNQPPTENRLNR